MPDILVASYEGPGETPSLKPESDAVPKSNGVDFAPTNRDEVQRNLQEMFAKASEDVRTRAAKLEQTVIRPLGDWATEFGKRRPIVATYLAVFLVLSALPFLSFIGFALLSTLLTALANIIVTIAFISFLFTVAGTILLVVLFCAALTAIFLTVAVLGTVAAYRLCFAVVQRATKT